ncbi:MAG: peptidoglycan-binding protein, partial [Acidimicrobiia bacterium]|nr:peptidoglycan-binding protein [Acidimicrobiia bacterium]
GVDAHFGPRTESAVKHFQRDVGLTVDGIVGRQTKTAVAGSGFDPGDTAILSLGSRGDAVRQLQSALSVKGFDAGRADGIFGPITLRAVLGFQQYQQLWVDGLVGPRTKSALGMM